MKYNDQAIAELRTQVEETKASILEAQATIKESTDSDLIAYKRYFVDRKSNWLIVAQSVLYNIDNGNSPGTFVSRAIKDMISPYPSLEGIKNVGAIVLSVIDFEDQE